METMKNVPILISLPRKFRDLLRRMAAERNLANPDQVISGAKIGAEIICDFLSTLESKKGGSIGGK